MRLDALFFANSALLGMGLAMDAFSVSLANGLAETDMPGRRMCLIAGTFAVFQALMPMTGWLCVHALISFFGVLERFVPWVALALLGYIGGRMIYIGIRGGDAPEAVVLGAGALLMQAVATSVDALSVGFTLAEYALAAALMRAVIIAAVTFLICMGGLVLGKKFGAALAGRASILGGAILIVIGLEIFLKGFVGGP